MSSCVKFSIPFIDSLIPECFPRSNFILLFGESGTGKSVTLIQIAGEKIKAGESCVFVAFDDSPDSIIDNFCRLGYECQEALEQSKLCFVDCFSFRARQTPKDRRGIRVVQNPKDRYTLTGIILSTVESLEGVSTVIIDSLTEFLTIGEPVAAVDTIKNWRVELCKMRNITVFASYHVGTKSVDEYASMLDYLVDGIVDFRFDPVFGEQGLLVRQLRIRKMKGSFHDTVWHYFSVEKRGLLELQRRLSRTSSEEAGTAQK